MPQMVSGPACDLIFLRDHIAEFEIGVNADEFGVKQRLRFTIELDVPRFTAEAEDSAANIVSYEIITRALSALAEGPRINLVETLAERLAARLLAEPRVARAKIRIEKLDHVSGSFGVEIERRSEG